MGALLFWFSAFMLPLNLYFAVEGTVSSLLSAGAAALNIYVMIMTRRAA